MARLNITKTRTHLQNFDFQTLFIEELGWSNPASKKSETLNIKDEGFKMKHIAQLSGVVILEVISEDGEIPNAKQRIAIHKAISKLHHENLIIFLNKPRNQSLWYWVKREGSKLIPREHIFVKGQPGDLFLSKLSSMVVDISELDENGEVSVLEVARRLKNALDIETTIKKFYGEYDKIRIQFVELIEGIDDERKRKWYASVLLNRLMFIYFLQKKQFLDNGNTQYLQDKLEQSKQKGSNLFYSHFLQKLFFEGFAKPTIDDETRKLIGNIKYLNGGLFIEHSIEEEYRGRIHVPDTAFENLFSLFASYSWYLDDTPGGNDNEINPDVLGYIFEKYINQKEFGAYYTRPEITEYLCDRTISKLILEKVNAQGIAGVKNEYTSLSDMLLDLKAPLCKFLLIDVLPNLSLLDPACGSGAFLVSAMKTLINIYSAIIGRIEFLSDPFLTSELKKIKKEHPSIGYFIKKRIITDNLFGVDIMEEATEIAKLRLFLALVAAAQTVDELEPLPNIDFNILAGNSLIGLMHVDEKQFNQRQLQGNFFQKSYREILEEKNRLIDAYRHVADLSVQDLREQRDTIEEKKKESITTLNEILLDEFGKNLKIKYEEATWDDKKNDEGKPKKRSLTIKDIEALHPFHWGFEFDRIIHKNGGFDAIITNPPWEIFKPQAKEFFMEHSKLVSKKKMDIKSFEKEMKKLLKDAEIRKAWFEYQNQFPHVSEYFRSSSQYANQISMVNGKKAGSDINLYKLFVEQCHNLLRDGGTCGIVIPSGIYTDLGTKQLREMLFAKSEITGLFCFENNRLIFEGVHRSFKFVVLTFEKGNSTDSFPAAFMRHEVEELERFPNEDNFNIHTDLVRKLSPDSLSILEFKSQLEVSIIEKMYESPLMGEEKSNTWNIQFTREVNNSSDMKYTKEKQLQGYEPLYEGKTIHQYDNAFESSTHFIDVKTFNEENSVTLNNKYPSDYYRICFRRQARQTDTWTFIATVAPKNRLFFDNMGYVRPFDPETKRVLMTNKEELCLLAFLNSFSLQFILRQKLNQNLSFYLLYELPVPRLTKGDKYFDEIVERAAKLICTTPEFDELAKEVGLGSHKNGVTNEVERAKLRAELDGMIAHLYGLTEEEFAYILTTFPIVKQEVKDAALEEYRRLVPTTDQQEIEMLIKAGESAMVEFKSTLCWDLKESKVNKVLEHVIVKTVAGFLNSEGGTLLIGVEDNGNILGLTADYKTLGKQQNKDGFENLLTTLLLDSYGKETISFINVTFCTLENKEVCKITIKPSAKPVYVKDEKTERLYIRAGNSTRELNAKEAVEYCRVHWK